MVSGWGTTSENANSDGSGGQDPSVLQVRRLLWGTGRAGAASARAVEQEREAALAGWELGRARSNRANHGQTPRPVPPAQTQYGYAKYVPDCSGVSGQPDRLWCVGPAGAARCSPAALAHSLGPSGAPPAARSVVAPASHSPPAARLHLSLRPSRSAGNVPAMPGNPPNPPLQDA
jgi:hypothetical protein